MTSTQQNEALQAVRLLYVAACGGGSSDHKNPEMIYRARVLLEGFIEKAQLPPEPKQWYPSDKPWSDVNIGGFTLLDEVKLAGSDRRYFVVGLHQEKEIIHTNIDNYVNPTHQERHSKENLTFVTHGKLE